MPLKPAVDIERGKHDIRRAIELSNPVQLVEDAMQREMDLQAHTEHRRMYQKKTRSGEFLPDTIVNRT